LEIQFPISVLCATDKGVEEIMKKIIFFIVFLNCKLLAQNCPFSFEQKAIDYYGEEIHKIESQKKEKYFLKDSVSNIKSNFLCKNCFLNFRERLPVAFFKIPAFDCDKTVQNTLFKPLKSKNNRKGFIVFVYKANSSPFNTVIVEVVVINNTMANHYYIEFDTSQNPLRWCKAGVIF
jgi:hypothetical protein